MCGRWRACSPVPRSTLVYLGLTGCPRLPFALQLLGGVEGYVIVDNKGTILRHSKSLSTTAASDYAHEMIKLAHKARHVVRDLEPKVRRGGGRGRTQFGCWCLQPIQPTLVRSASCPVPGATRLPLPCPYSPPPAPSPVLPSPPRTTSTSSALGRRSTRYSVRPARSSSSSSYRCAGGGRIESSSLPGLQCTEVRACDCFGCTVVVSPSLPPLPPHIRPCPFLRPAPCRSGSLPSTRLPRLPPPPLLLP
jgi:hypothetical protein